MINSKRSARASLAIVAGLLLSAAPALTARQTTPTVHRPLDGPALVAAMGIAQPCDRIILTTGQPYTVSNLITALRPTGPCPITLETSGTLPAGRLPEGADGEILPTVQAQLAILRTLVNEPVITIATPGWKLVGLHLQSPTPNDTVVIDGGHSATLDRVYMKGSAAGTKRGVMIGANDVTIVDSLIHDYKKIGQDSQAIAQLEGCGTLILNNVLEGAAENLMLGGDDPRPGRPDPCRIRIRGNLLRKRPAWEHETWTVKNLFEIKNGRDVEFQGNRLVNSWNRAQRFAIVLTPANQGGTNPTARVADVRILDNEVVNAYSCLQVTGWGYTFPTEQTTGIVVRNLRCELRGGELAGIGQEVGDITLEHLTSTATGGAWAIQLVAEGHVKAPDGTNRVPQHAVGTLTLRNSMVACQGGGIRSTEGNGLRALGAFVKNPVVWTRNVFGGCTTAAETFPPDTLLPTSTTFDAQLGADARLVATSLYKGAGSDSLDIGWLGLPATTPTPPPAPPPPSPTPVADVDPPVIESVSVVRTSGTPHYRVTAVVNDNLGVARILCYVDGEYQGLQSAPSGTNQSTYGCGVKITKPGAHVVRVVAHDVSGLVAQADRQVKR